MSYSRSVAFDTKELRAAVVTAHGLRAANRVSEG